MEINATEGVTYCRCCCLQRKERGDCDCEYFQVLLSFSILCVPSPLTFFLSLSLYCMYVLLVT
jgi:hypothetical protein